MNILKGLYIGAYFGAGALAAIYSAWMLFSGVPTWGWAGALLATAPVPLYLGYLYLFMYKPRTHPHLPQSLIPAAAGTAIAGYAVTIGADWLPLALAGGPGLLGGLVYTYWYSISPKPNNFRIREGAALPAFALKDMDGAKVTSEDLKGHYNLLMFYRGNWCPLCMAQIREVAAHYRDLAQRGVRVSLISPQPDRHTRTLAKRFNLPMQFLRDAGNRTAKVLGILNKNGVPVGMDVFGYDRDAPYPSLVLCDPELRVVKAELSLNYRVRPEPQEFRTVIVPPRPHRPFRRASQHPSNCR